MGILAVVLAILAAVCAFLATLLFGTTGGIIAAVIAVVAIALAVLKRIKTQKGGIAAIVISVLAIILAISMTSVTSTMFKTLHEKAVEYIPDGLWAKVSEETNGGFMGLVKNMPSDEATLNALVDEMNELNRITDEKGNE
ncbi:MAG: hypothetical protein IJ231_04665 [Clostridia bacterium]|nr:hypothetical protein [Clostridia bacterium]